MDLDRDTEHNPLHLHDISINLAHSRWIRSFWAVSVFFAIFLTRGGDNGTTPDHPLPNETNTLCQKLWIDTVKLVFTTQMIDRVGLNKIASFAVQAH